MNSTEDYLANPTAAIIQDYIYSVKYKISLGSIWLILLLLGILGKFNFY
jgi:hypothetical protein